jgi:hypothetical protein
MTLIFARLAMERGTLGDELADRKGTDHDPGAVTPLDPGTPPGRLPALPNPLLDELLWYWPERRYAMDYAEQLYPGE